MQTQTEREFIFDPESLMPRWVQKRHHDTVSAACFAYRLRNAAEEAEDFDRAHFYLAAGDRFLCRAQALTNDWDEPVS